MKQKLHIGRGFTLVELLVVIVIIAALAGLTAPMVIRQRKKADQTEAVNNARQIGLAMFEFETEYGSFPGEDTGAKVNLNTQSTLTYANGFSNGFFRQLLGAGYTQSESMFYSKVPKSTKPDGAVKDAAAVAKGECGFGYIVAGTTGLSTAGNSMRPYVVTPLFGTSGETFDAAPFDGKAVILRIDNSVSSLQILPDKTVNISPGKKLLATGDGTVWETPAGGGLSIKFPDL
jgi:prepilin-type N-terminal cleavage/methylation domain-containing protein